MRIMQVLQAENIENIKNIDFEGIDGISADFSNVENIDLKTVNALINLKKAAVLNNKTISITGANPNVSRMLDLIGLEVPNRKYVSNPLKKG